MKIIKEKYSLRSYIVTFVLLASSIAASEALCQEISNEKLSRPLEPSADKNYIVSETMLDEEGVHKIMSVQYYDGLGRPNVLATNGVNTIGKFVYSMTEYDMQGRESRKWLPVVGGTTPNFKTNLFKTSNYGYADTEYDVLDRPTFISTAGQEWIKNGKGVSTEYITNTDSSVKRYVVTSENNAFKETGLQSLVTS